MKRNTVVSSSIIMMVILASIIFIFVRFMDHRDHKDLLTQEIPTIQAPSYPYKTYPQQTDNTLDNLMQNALIYQKLSAETE